MGWMVHTRFFGDQADALREYEQMKTAIAAVLSRIPDAAHDNDDVGFQMSRVCSEIEDFVKMYP